MGGCCGGSKPALALAGTNCAVRPDMVTTGTGDRPIGGCTADEEACRGIAVIGKEGYYLQANESLGCEW